MVSSRTSLADDPHRPGNTLGSKSTSAVTTGNPGDDSSAIFQGQSPPAPKPLAPPDYRQQALRKIVSLNRSKGISTLSFSELALQLRDKGLRGKVDPLFEPLSLESINAAVADLTLTQELEVHGRIVVFPAPPAPAGGKC